MFVSENKMMENALKLNALFVEKNRHCSLNNGKDLMNSQNLVWLVAFKLSLTDIIKGVRSKLEARND